MGNLVAVAPDGASATAVLVSKFFNQAGLGFWDYRHRATGRPPRCFRASRSAPGSGSTRSRRTFGADSGSVTGEHRRGSSIDPAVVAADANGSGRHPRTGTSGRRTARTPPPRLIWCGHLAGTWDVTPRIRTAPPPAWLPASRSYPTPHLISILPNSGYDNAVPATHHRHRSGVDRSLGSSGGPDRYRRLRDRISPDGTQINTFDLQPRAAGL